MKRGKDRHALGWINRVSKGKRRYVVLMLAIQAVLALAGVGYALLFREIIDSAVAGDGVGLKRGAICLAAVVLSQIALRCVYRHLTEYTRAALENAMKSRLFSVLLRKDYAAVTATHSGEWLNRLTSDTVVVANDITEIIPNLGGMAIRMVAALVMLLVMEPRFGGIFLVGGVAMILMTVVLRRKLKVLHKDIQAADGSLRVFLSERIASMMTIRAFSKERSALEQGNAHMDAHKAARMKRSRFSNLCNTGMGVAMHGTYIICAIYCCYEIFAGRMSYGTLTAILQLVSQAQSPMANISGVFPKYYAMLASAERLMEAEAFEEERSEPAVEDMCAFYQDMFRGIKLQDISFTYRDEKGTTEVLQHLDLEIGKGEYIAFTGPSGCGKSTVLKLLLCLYHQSSGERFILSSNDRVPMSAAWRSLFAYVPQGNQLMNGTIREVVTFGEGGNCTKDDAVYRALEIACADHFVRELKDGLDTVLGERGAGLSEGQMQRIAVARAIYSDRPILLLDEATSALDEATEKQLLQNLQAMTNKTVIIVTHRPAVLAVTDREIRFGREEEVHA